MPAQPISLYIDLQPGRTAELEVVARASLEFAAGLREIAYLVDPSFEFRIELERGDEGSLWLKTFVRWIRGLHHANPTLFAVTASAASWFASNAAWYGTETFILDPVFKQESETARGLTAEELAQVADQIARIQGSRTPDVHFKNVLRELSTDNAVSGVGVSPQHDIRPRFILPREEFATRISRDDEPAVVGERRTRRLRGDFVIIRPVLKEGGGRWRLRGPGGEFSATIADDDFYNSILRGEAPVPLAAEVHISADLEAVDERVEGGAWKPISYRITQVHSIDRQPQQSGLSFPRR